MKQRTGNEKDGVMLLNSPTCQSIETIVKFTVTSF